MASEIRVNKIENRSGLGTVTFADTGVDLAGITTASTLRATTGIITTLQVGTISGDGSSLTGVAATDNVRTGILDVAGVGTFRNDVNIADKIIHLGDTNTAIRFPSADTITAETGGSERLRITSDGKIGINDSTPSVTLETVGHNQVTFGSMPETIISYGTASAYNSGSAGSGIQFGGYYNSTPEYTIFAGVHGVKENTTNSNYAGNLVFSTRTNGGNSAERLRITSGGKLLGGNYFTSQQIGAVTAPVQIQGTSADTSALSLFRYSNDTGGSTITLGKGRGTSGGAADKPQENDTVGTIHFHVANNNDLVNGNVAAIDVQVDDAPGGGDTPGRIRFLTSPDGSSTLSERLRITKDGTVTNSQSGNAPTSGGAWGFTQDQLYLSTSGTSANYALRFYNDNGLVGSVLVNGSGVTYNTSSDYRLKENQVLISDGITRLKQLKPYRFNFKADPSTTVDGFLAHETQSVVPESVSGTKDQIANADNVADGLASAVGDPVHQGIDQSKLVPLLTAALQEAVAKIEVLETRLNNAGIAT